MRARCWWHFGVVRVAAQLEPPPRAPGTHAVWGPSVCTAGSGNYTMPRHPVQVVGDLHHNLLGASLPLPCVLYVSLFVLCLVLKAVPRYGA